MNENPKQRHRVPELLVEKLHLGELTPPEAARVRARLEEHGELGRLDALAQSDRELAPRLPPLRVSPATSETRPRRWLTPALALAAAALALLIAWPALMAPGDPRDELRAKGGPVLIVYRLGPRGPELLSHGTTAREGDRLQLLARLPSPAHAAILSVDGLGVVTVHQPPTEAPVRELQVPSSFVLDGAPRHERFFLFVSAAPMQGAMLVAALERLPTSGLSEAAPELPEEVLVLELRLDKQAPK